MGSFSNPFPVDLSQFSFPRWYTQYGAPVPFYSGQGMVLPSLKIFPNVPVLILPTKIRLFLSKIICCISIRLGAVFELAKSVVKPF